MGGVGGSLEDCWVGSPMCWVAGGGGLALLVVTIRANKAHVLVSLLISWRRSSEKVLLYNSDFKLKAI